MPYLTTFRDAACAAAVGLASLATEAATFSVAHHFNSADGSTPMGELALDSAGNVYGTASGGERCSGGWRLWGSGPSITSSILRTMY